ncbi:related to integral membrane protein [Cephalotrichum gorgonifer]|uniref:Related to integral membrane protein n=1 Tax=Cephalotrichum gorgonifer TaxID=2041049 RepID=A0AAE8SXU4_9PEZI|nr:related to integral membrane protein [Cephalotrichum gorgonifer]
MADASAGAPPPELIPGYYDDRSWVSIFYVVLCLTVATIMVGMRIWTRKAIINKMGIDDWAAIITLVVTWGEGITIALSTKYGLGKHIFAVQPPTLIKEYWKCFWITLLLYCAGLFGAKMTFLFQYYRILAVQNMRIVYIVAIIVVGAWSFAQVLIAILICRPIQGLWDKTIDAQCMPNEPQIYVNAAGNIVTDIAVFLLPLPALKQLNLKRTQKLLLFGIFSLGFFTVGISVVRIKYLHLTDDVTWQHVESSGWSIGELASALTCSSLPTLRPFFAKYFPSLGMSWTGERPSYNINTIGGSGGNPGSNGASRGTRAKRSANPRGSADSLVDKAEYDLRTTESGNRSITDDNTGAAVVDEERLLGLRTTTKTEIQYSGSQSAPGLGAAIQVQKEVYQTNTMRQDRW